GVSLPVYRGDLVNGRTPTLQSRTASVDRLERGYFIAAASMNLIRRLSSADNKRRGRQGAVFISHEGLVPPYESGLTHCDAGSRGHYNLGAHTLWIGERTRGIDDAHVEYFRGLANPIGLKVGPSCKPAELARLAQKLDPTRVPGRLTVISRLGAPLVER